MEATQEEEDGKQHAKEGLIQEEEDLKEEVAQEMKTAQPEEDGREEIMLCTFNTYGIHLLLRIPPVGSRSKIPQINTQ